MDIEWIIANNKHRLSEENQKKLREMAEESRSKTDFTKSWRYADITFLVEGKPLYACKMVLAMWSPVFEAMFSDNFKEKNAKEIKLPGKNYDDMVELMKVLHPPNQEICEENVVQLLPLLQEYQIDTLLERAEEFLLSQASSVRNYLLAHKYNLTKLMDSNLSYMKRAPISRIKNQPEFDQLDHQMLIDLLVDKCDKFESNMESLREVRMVLERKKPTTFPGMHLLCESCTEAREQQVDCPGCMKSCCKKITEILRNLER